MHTTQAIEGITLATFAFQESSHILSVFTKELGRIKCVTKSFRKNQLRGLCPLLGVELQVIPSDKELWKCKECVVATSYPSLRTSLEHLQYAAQITNLLDKLLPLQHPVEHIYVLYEQFLIHLPNFSKPHVAACLFLEKYLVMEGMLESGSALDLASFTAPYEGNVDVGYYQKLLHVIGR